MEEGITVVGDYYEVHPGASGGWAVVASRTGEAVASYSRERDAVRDAERREEERKAREFTARCK